MGKDWRSDYQKNLCCRIARYNPDLISSWLFKYTKEPGNHAVETVKWNNLDATKLVVQTSANATPGGNQAIRMNSAYRIGPAKSFKVFPCDVITGSVSAYFTTTSGFTAATTATMITALSAVLGGGVPAIDGGISTAYNTTNNPLIALGGFSGSTFPSGYLNYILFDENYVPIRAKSFPVQNLPSTRHSIQFDQPLEIKELGYLFVYLSYDNNQSAYYLYFDDLRIVVEESPLIQVNNYYPFGMVSATWLREGEQQNANLFQGKELISQTGWHDFGSRMYWADLGRWFSTDPQKQFSSPYVGMGNMPVMGRDRNGEWFGLDDLFAAGISFLAGYISHGISSGDWGASAFEVGGQAAVMGWLAYNTIGLSKSAMGAKWTTASLGTHATNAALGIGTSQLPSASIQIDNLTFGISPFFAYGSNGISGGLSFSGSAQIGDFSLGGSLTAMHNANSIGVGGKSGEFRTGYGVGYNDGHFHADIYANSFTTTNGTSQRVGGIGFGGPGWNARYENDWPFPGDGGDRFRSAAARLDIGEFSTGINLFTGDPGLDSKDRDRYKGKNDQTFYKEKTSQYRAGIFYVGYGNYHFGADSELVRDLFQNRIIHSLFKVPYFEVLNKRMNPCGQMKSRSAYTLW